MISFLFLFCSVLNISDCVPKNFHLYQPKMYNEYEITYIMFTLIHFFSIHNYIYIYNSISTAVGGLSQYSLKKNRDWFQQKAITFFSVQVKGL